MMNQEDLIYILSIIITSLWVLPNPIWFAQPGIDPSSSIAWNIVFLKNLQYGKDIVFMYGPLSFLYQPLLIDHELWINALFFNIIANFLFVLAVFILLRQLSVKAIHLLIFIPLLILIRPQLNYEVILTASFFIYAIIINIKVNSRERVLLWLIPLGFFLAIASLMKFDILILSALLIGLSTIIFLADRFSYRYWIWFPISYLISIINMWEVAGQDISNFPNYIFTGMDVFRGYGAAMAIEGPAWQIYMALLSLISLAMISAIYYKSIKIELRDFLLLNSCVLFAAFRYSFVRQDEFHTPTFFHVCLLIFSIMLILIFYRNMKMEKGFAVSLGVILNIAMIFLLIIALSNIIQLDFNSFALYKLSGHNSYDLSTQLVMNSTLYYQYVQNQKEVLKQDYPLDHETISYINDNSIDIFPWDVALCWTYGFNWSPRPMFQSITAYTIYLDNINSQFLMGYYSPSVILYAFKSIDGRYPLFDEPAAFRTILRHYVYINSTNEFALLKKNISNAEIRDQQVNLGRIETKFRTYIPVPKYRGGLIFGHIELNQSLMGKIIGALYKPDPIYIQFKLRDGTITNKFRFIPENSKNGLFLSEYIENIDDLSLLFKGNLIRYNIIDGIYIVTDNPKQYDDTIRIEFNGMPSNISVDSQKDIELARLLRSAKKSNSKYINSGKGCLNGSCRSIIFQHPESEILFNNVTIPSNAILKFGIALDPQVWSPEKGDGVVFKVQIRDNQFNKTIFSRYIDPKNCPLDRKWRDYDINLSSFGNRNVDIAFDTACGPRNDCAYDWAWWGEPVLILDSTSSENPKKQCKFVPK